eukprot:10849531-Alexandrium_andersonii.AAC.1
MICLLLLPLLILLPLLRSARGYGWLPTGEVVAGRPRSRRTDGASVAGKTERGGGGGPGCFATPRG